MNLLVLVLLAVSQAHYGHSGPVVLPDLKVTPGLAAISDTHKICTTKWGKDERHVTQKMKLAVCRQYGQLTGCPGKGYETDHLISRELGGADDVRNLWPQPAPDFHEKDKLENALHKEVCAGTTTLKDAQSCLVDNWWACYKARYKL